MKIELSIIYDEVITNKSIVITTEQKTSIQKLVNREFFSWVQPIHFLVNKDLEEIIKLDKTKTPDMGLKIEADEYGLGIGKFEIQCIRKFNKQTAIKILPLDYSAFKIETEYQGDYALTCEFFLMRSQKDNMALLGGIGVQDFELDIMTLQELREILESHYGTSTSQSVELNQENNEC